MVRSVNRDVDLPTVGVTRLGIADAKIKSDRASVLASKSVRARHQRWC